MTEKNSKRAGAVAAEGDSITLVDARGLRCPLPLLKAKQALHGVQEGERVRVLATDPGSVRDFNSYAQLSGHCIEQFKEDNGQYEYLLIKK